MILYCVDPPADESEPEGLDRTEWFSSKDKALKRYNQLVREIEEAHKDWLAQFEDSSPDRKSPLRSKTVQLEQIEIADLPKKALVLALLNRRGFVVNRSVLRSTEKPKQ